MSNSQIMDLMRDLSAAHERIEALERRLEGYEDKISTIADTFRVLVESSNGRVREAVMERVGRL